MQLVVIALRAPTAAVSSGKAIALQIIPSRHHRTAGRLAHDVATRRNLSSEFTATCRAPGLGR
jgi:hypothetical protein